MPRKKAKSKDSGEQAAEETSVEDAMAELGSVVKALEGGQETLEDSLKLFERGMSLLRICHRQLDSAAQRIEVITKLTADGVVETAEFDGTDSVSKAKSRRTESDSGGELF